MTPLGTRIATLATSAAIHAGVAVCAGGHAPPATSAAVTGLQLVELPAPPVETFAEAPTSAAGEARAPHASFPTHTHPYPVPPSHEATPHDPSIVHVSSAHDVPAPTVAAASEVLTASAPEPARFVMTVGSAAVIRGGATAHEAGGDARGSAEETANEDGVDARPVLLSGNAPRYPAAAAAAGIEVDVPVSIVVGADGNVVEARPLTHFGFGLDESALRAVQGYRFSRGLRGGRPVRVRMTWTVMFRLQ